ncbi:MAG: zinc-binding dehydrogenase, partial [Planctomycetota bacterium]
GALGADFACEPAGAKAAVDSISSGEGVDAVFDTAGGCEALDACLQLGRRGSTVVLFAHAEAGEMAGFELNRLFKEERRLVGSYSGGVEDQDAAWELMLSGALDASMLVSARVGLDQFDKALELVCSRQGLKVLMEP